MPPATLTARVSRSVRWAFLESVISAAASLLTVIVVARLLVPAEFGRAGIAMAVAAIVQAALLGGMPDAVARSRSVHTGLTDAAFWAMLAIGGIAAGLCLAAGAFVAAAMGEPQLGALIAVQGLGGIALGAAAVPTGLLLRKLRTRALVGRTAWSKLTGLAVSVALALAGAGAWALVLGSVLAQVAATAQLLATMRRPVLRLRDPLLGETLRVGLMSGAQGSFGTLTTRGFLLAFGAVYGVHAAGLFNFALRLVEESCGLVIATLRRVTVSAFAAAKRGGADLRHLFARGTSAIAYVAAPLFLGGAAVAGDAVPLLFGPQWLPAVPILQLMLAMWVVRAVRMLVNATMVVEGRQRAMVGFAAAGLAATALAFVLSLPLGIEWTVAAYAASLTGVAFGGRAFKAATGIGVGEQVRPVLLPLLCALAMVAVVTLLRHGPLAPLAAWLRLLLAIGAGGAAFAGLALSLDRAAVTRVWRVLKR